MRVFSSLHLLGALGTLAAAAAASAADPSQWKCESCPYPKGTSGSVDAGVGVVSSASPQFGDYTGLQRRGAHLVFGGTVSRRGDDGYFADLAGVDLGLDARSVFGEAGREGLYSLRVGYLEVPRHLSEGAATPFLGNGGAALTLPAGFPAASTATMPLAGTLQPIELGYTYKRYDLAVSANAGRDWSYRVNLRHDVRDGTKATSGSFFNTASQLAAPVDQVTDQLEVSVSYATRLVQATLGYQLSMFRNDHDALTWSNPFFPVVGGSSKGQLALAPDNQFHQILGSAGYDITPKIRVSGDFALGRMTQDAAYLAPTLNAILAPTVPALPAQSLRGRANTFDGGVKITAAPLENLRLNASYARDRRDNRTPVQSYPSVATDMFLEPTPRSNTPFSFTQDRFKIGADYRGPRTLRFSGGAEQDDRERSYQEVVTTRETTVWGRVAAQPRDDLSVSLKLAHSGRNNSAYGRSVWFGYPENPLLRKYYLADRQRNSAAARAEYTLGERATVALSADWSNDDYSHSVIGLTSARTFNIGADVSVNVSERTQLHAFAQDERIRSRQTGSEAFAGPDWTGQSRDSFDVLGLGIKHVAIVNKLDIGSDLTISRSRSRIAVDNAVGAPPFPSADTQRDSLKLYATYKLKDSLWLTGSYWYEHYDAQDWRLDGILPATVSNLLAFGAQPPRYTVNVLRVALRYRF